MFIPNSASPACFQMLFAGPQSTAAGALRPHWGAYCARPIRWLDLGEGPGKGTGEREENNRKGEAEKWGSVEELGPKV